jgi:signal transduction histidine kinase
MFTAEERVQHLLALNQAAIAITAELELDSLLQRIVDSARQLVGCDYAALGVLGDDGYIERFPTSGVSEIDREKIGAPPRGHGLLGIMLRAGQTLRIADISKDPRRVGFPPHHPAMTSLLGVPIFVQGKLVGDLYLTDKNGGPEFSEEDEWLVHLLATHAATALLNAQLHAEARRGREAAEREGQRLRELEQMKDEFLSTAAHELRTPLTAIRMSAGLLQEQLQLLTNANASNPTIDPRLLELTELVLESSQRMQALVNDLLDLTRLEQGRAGLASEELDLRHVITASVEATAPLFKAKGQHLAVSMPEGRLTMQGDAERLEQVLINLLSNAHKYSPAGARVQVRASRSGNNYVVTVRDNGSGVPADEREAIFERFYRSSLHRNDRTSSTGLGLPIARKIAEMHHGRLWVEPAPDGGSIFTLTLPASGP